MKESAIRKFLIIIQAGILIFGCARISVPTGGPKDKDIPVILKSLPENGATNFRGNEIIVSFDEYVVLDQITEKFMVSPPMKRKPEIFTRGKSIRIEFENELRDSTTYTFYFQDAIKDLNESNAINNYQFVFSTGSFIDSLSVTGNVYSAPDLDPPENALVLLYNQPEDSSVVKQLPDYITRAEKNGEFRIDNVRTGTYRLYALVDADNSKNYNSRDELFAFYSEPVTITPEKNYLPVIKDTAVIKPVDGKVPFKPPLMGEYPLVLFQAEKSLYYLTSSSRKSSYQLIYTLSLPPDSLEFDFSIPGASSGSFFIEKTRDHDTVTVWLTDSTVYNRSQIETIVRYPFTDTLGITGLKEDTIDMRYIVPRAPRSRIARRVPYKVDGFISGQVRPDKQIILTASAPFLPPDTSKIMLYEMLKEEKIRHPFKLVKDTSNSSRYFVESDFKPGRNYLFIADSAAFQSIYGEYSDSTGNRFSVRTPESFGKLILDIKGYEGNRIIQLFDNSEKLVRQTRLTKNGKLEYPLLEKGPYRLRAIFDLNNDGKWTTGDFDTHRQPEPVLYYPEEFEIKENWEITQPWELEIKNSKEPKLQKIKTGTR
jgi:hypothetical protein